VIALYRHHLHRVRARGIDVFVLPTPHPISGMAFECPKTGKKFITVCGSIHSRLWLFVLLHEEVHIRAGHTRVISVSPYWSHEYEADRKALDQIAVLQPYAFARCEAESKARFRNTLQAIIDEGAWYSYDEGVARWAGCTLPTLESMNE
jgi:hypothetical protein